MNNETISSETQNPCVLNSWGLLCIHHYDTRGKKSTTIHFKGDNNILKLIFLEYIPTLTFPECLTAVSSTITEYLIETRDLFELHYKGACLKWSEDHQLIRCDAGSFYHQSIPQEFRKPSHVITSVIDEVLRQLTQHFQCERTWIHDMILNRPLDEKHYEWLHMRPDVSCATMRVWLAFVRNLMLLPPTMPITQRRILPGKPGLFVLLKLPLEKRQTLPVYRALKHFLTNTDERKDHQDLYWQFLRLITSSDSADIDHLVVDETSETVQTLRLYYQELKRKT